MTVVAVADRPGTLTPLRHPDFRRFWLGDGLSALGSSLTELALPLLILGQTHSPVLAGLVGTLRVVAYLLVQLPAGVLADRLNRRTVLLVGEASRGVLVAVIGIALATGVALPIAALAGLAVASSLVSAVADPAGQAVTRHLVGSDEIGAALALGSATGQAMALAAPLIGGLCYQVWPALPFLIDAASYLISLVALAFIGATLGGGSSTETTGSILADIRAGLRFLRGSRFLSLYLGWAALGNFATAGIAFLLVVAVQPTGGTHLGLALSLVAVAGLAGSVLAPRIGRLPLRRVVAVGLGSRIVVAGIMAAHPTPVVLTAGAMLITLVGPSMVIPYNSHVFTVVPDQMMARVQSAMILVGGSLYPFAAVVVGLLVKWFAISATLMVLAVLFSSLLAIAMLPAMRIDRRGSTVVPANSAHTAGRK